MWCHGARLFDYINLFEERMWSCFLLLNLFVLAFEVPSKRINFFVGMNNNLTFIGFFKVYFSYS